jgi:hypothetical protein
MQECGYLAAESWRLRGVATLWSACVLLRHLSVPYVTRRRQMICPIRSLDEVCRPKRKSRLTRASVVAPFLCARRLHGRKPCRLISWGRCRLGLCRSTQAYQPLRATLDCHLHTYPPGGEAYTHAGPGAGHTRAPGGASPPPPHRSVGDEMPCPSGTTVPSDLSFGPISCFTGCASQDAVIRRYSNIQKTPLPRWVRTHAYRAPNAGRTSPPPRRL